MKDKQVEIRGKQVEIRELNASGLIATLDNGVAVRVSFNNGSVHLHFSGTDSRLKIREDNLMNYVTVQYEPAK